MANVLVEESCLSGIASAIRTQNGLSTLYKPSEMMSGINDLRASEAWAIFYNSLSSAKFGSEYFNSTSTMLKVGAFAGLLNNPPNFILPNVSLLDISAISLPGIINPASIGAQFMANYTKKVSLGNVTSIPGMTFNGCRYLSDITFGTNNIVNLVGIAAFADCDSLESIPFGITGTISELGFGSCQKLSYINLNAKSIGKRAFEACWSLSYINLPSATWIGELAFSGCSRLSSISLPNAQSIYSAAFYSTNLSGEINLPAVKTFSTTIIFSNYYTLDTSFWLNLPNYSSSLYYIGGRGCVGVSAPNVAFLSWSNSFLQWVSAGCSSASFNRCTSLISASLINLVSASYTFNGCENLVNISLPACEIIGSYTFSGCYNLSSLTLPKTSIIYNYAFYKCSKLVSLYLTSTAVCKLNTVAGNVFAGCPIYDSTVNNNVYGSIYVPSSLYATYIASTNWISLSARFVSM